MIWINKQSQSIYDVCLQTYGTLNLLYKLIQDNSISNINEFIGLGKRIIFDQTLINDFAISNHNEIENIVYTTLINANINIYTGAETNAGGGGGVVSGGLLNDDGVQITNDDGISITID